MKKKKNLNFTKKEISKEINFKTGFPSNYCINLIDDLIKILKVNIKNKELNIKNFGTFKTISKKERLGRNPKTKEIYSISARKSLSFLASKKLFNKINNIR